MHQKQNNVPTCHQEKISKVAATQHLLLHRTNVTFMPEGWHQFKGIRAVPPKPAPLLIFHQETTFLPATPHLRNSSPGRAETHWGLGAGRAGLSSAKKPAWYWGGGRGSQVWLFLWPLGWALVGVGLLLGSPSSPLLPRAPSTVIGPDIRFSYTPFSTPPAPLGLQGAFRAVL